MKIKASIINLCILFSLFISLSSIANEYADFDKALSTADDIRTSNPKLFSELLAKLNKKKAQLSQSQENYLDYLNTYHLIYQGKLDEAIRSSRELLASDAGTLIKFRTRLSMINTFANSQNWTEGLSHLSSALEELPLIKNKKNHHLALIIASIFYNQLGQYELGLFYAKKLDLLAAQGRDDCLAKGQIVESLFKLKKLLPDDPIIEKAITSCLNNNENLMVSFILYHISNMHLENKNTEKALKILNSNLEQTKETNYPRILAKYYALLAKAYWQLDNLELTKHYSLESLKHEKKNSITHEKAIVYQFLYKIAQSQKSYELALHYHQEYAIADKLYYDETQAKHLAFQLAKHKAIEQKNKIDLLNERNALLTAEQALANANVENTRLIVMVLALTLSVLIFWGIRLLKAHKRIKELAEFDALTGVFNRGHFTVVANKALEYCQSAEQELSLIMFDLDYFKKINDNFGHACGDWALKKTIEACKSISRQNDIFARLGGEEFCILLTSCNSSSALEIAESYRKAIEKISSQGSGYEFTLTASFGVTDTKTSGYDLENILADADSAAYTSKHNGRNQVTLYTQPKPVQKVIQLDDSRDAF